MLSKLFRGSYALFNRGSSSVRTLGLSLGTLRDSTKLELFLLASNKGFVDFVDCSWKNGNEPFVGLALRNIKLKDPSFRLNFGFQTKVWHTKFKFGINKSIRFAIQKLGAHSCLDCFFLHNPSDSWSVNLSAFRQLIDCKSRGQAIKIGLTNFGTRLIQKLYEFTNRYPDILQLNLSLNNLNTDALEFCASQNISLQALEPFGNLRTNLKNPILLQLAQKYSCSVQTILLAYLLELGITPVFVAVNPEELQELAKAKSINLQAQDLEILASFNKYRSKTKKI